MCGSITYAGVDPEIWGGGSRAPPKLLPQGLCPPPHRAIEYARKILQHHDSIYRLFKNFLPHEYELQRQQTMQSFLMGKLLLHGLYTVLVLQDFSL